MTAVRSRVAALSQFRKRKKIKIATGRAFFTCAGIDATHFTVVED